MLTSYVMGLAVLVAISVGWLGIQRAWWRAFADESADPDALAGRLGCHGCGCSEPCERRSPDPSGPAEEEQP